MHNNDGDENQNSSHFYDHDNNSNCDILTNCDNTMTHISTHLTSLTDSNINGIHIQQLNQSAESDGVFILDEELGSIEDAKPKHCIDDLSVGPDKPIYLTDSNDDDDDTESESDREQSHNRCRPNLLINPNSARKIPPRQRHTRGPLSKPPFPASLPINIDRGCLLYHPAIEDICDEIEDEGDDGHGDHKTNAMKVKDTSDIYNSIRAYSRSIVHDDLERLFERPRRRHTIEQNAVERFSETRRRQSGLSVLDELDK